MHRSPTGRVGTSILPIRIIFESVILKLSAILLLYITFGCTPKILSHGFTIITSVHSFSVPGELDKMTHQEDTNDHCNDTYCDITHRIGIITDLDSNSKSQHEENTWVSYFKKGHLIWNPRINVIRVVWDQTEPIQLKSRFGYGGRGMELSDLVVFNGKLLSFDDRTGLIYEIDTKSNIAIPWVVLIDGNGSTIKGFKSEWASVKDHQLYVGSTGMEWMEGGRDPINHDPMWIKTVSTTGQVTHVDWEEQYNALRNASGVDFPGYMIHESGVWSDTHQRWFFLPRRLSKARYNNETDEMMGTNILLSSDQYFKDIRVTYIGEAIPAHGFSSFKFVPATNDSVVVALKTEEVQFHTATYIMSFHIDGHILLPETKISDLKYEGIEFIDIKQTSCGSKQFNTAPAH